MSMAGPIIGGEKKETVRGERVQVIIVRLIPEGPLGLLQLLEVMWYKPMPYPA